MFTLEPEGQIQTSATFYLSITLLKLFQSSHSSTSCKILLCNRMADGLGVSEICKGNVLLENSMS